MGLFNGLTKSFEDKKKPIVFQLMEAPVHIIYRHGIMSKIGIIENKVYIYDELNKGFYKVNLSNGLFEDVEDTVIENIEKSKSIILNKESILWQLNNAACISAMMWSGSSTFQVDDVFMSITTQVNDILNRYNVVVELSKDGWIIEHNRCRITMAELVEVIQTYNSEEEIQIDENWEAVRDLIKQEFEANTVSIIPEDTRNFTETTYTCPICGKFITKVLLKETHINVNGEKKEIDKTFSCKHCNSFYAPVINYPLGVGAFYFLKVSPSRYREIVLKMDKASRKA